jgi:hypothetical protein
VLVLGRDAVREFVQVGLADQCVARVLQPPNGLGGPLGDVLPKDRRAVRRDEPRGVEEVLDAQGDARADLVRPGEERV